MSSSILTYPEGFREPRHYHETCGHYMYILEGRIKSPEGDLTPGMFAYAAPGERHGPYEVLEPSKALFYTDGPLDFIVDEAE
jgi:mannose-6-phosphate isomerase-like protein (cupin superfamily)